VSSPGPDPSNAVMNAIEHSGGGWGAVAVIATSIIGGIVGFALPASAKRCVDNTASDGSFTLTCQRFIAEIDSAAMMGNVFAGVALGSLIGLGLWLVYRHLRAS
jgi:hypothetical protein